MIYMSLIYIFLLVGSAIASIAFFRRLSTRWHLFLLSLCGLLWNFTIARDLERIWFG